MLGITKLTHMPQRGSAISFQPDLFQPETLTSGPSSMCGQMTSTAIRSVTFLPESVDGHALSGSLDGTTTGQLGPGPAPASRSQSRGSKLASATNATYGHNSGALSRSDALQQSLENRLRERLTGSVSCEVTWKPWITPWGQSLWKPRARMRTICATAIGLWPTMTSNAPARNGNSEAGNSAGQVALRKILLALWPTATTPSGGQKNPPGTTLAGRRPNGTKATVTLQNVVLALWSTLRASDGAKGGPNMSFGAGGSPLPSQVSTVANISNAPMENGGGSLHPEFAGWAMGYPPEWLNCAPLAIPSTRARRASS